MRELRLHLTRQELPIIHKATSTSVTFIRAQIAALATQVTSPLKPPELILVEGIVVRKDDLAD